MSEVTNKEVPTKVTNESSNEVVSAETTSTANDEQGDDSVYNRGQQSKWTKTRKADKRDEDSKRAKRPQREHKVT
jgi:hypothetical protein